MEFKRSILRDPIEVLIPLIDPATGEFVTTDVLVDSDIKVYYWDKSAGTPAYTERAFSGTHELVVPANGTVYLHRIAFNRSMFDGANEIDFSRPVGVAVVDQSGTKVFKDTGFDIYLSPEMNIRLSASPVMSIASSGNRVIKITAEVFDCWGVKAVPYNSDISIRAYRILTTGEAISDDFYKDAQLTTAADSSGLSGGKKMVEEGSEVGQFYIYFKVPDTYTASQLWFQTLARPGINDGDYTQQKSLSCYLSDNEKKIDVVDTVVDGIDSQLDTVEGKIDVVDTVVDGIDTQLDTVEGKVDIVDTVVDSIDSQLDTVEGKVDSIQNNTRTVIGLPNRFNIPDTGFKSYKITLNFYDTSGNMEDPDDNEFSIDVELPDATDKNSILYKEEACINPLDSSVKFSGYKILERTGVGRYFCFVKVSDSETGNQLMYDFACEESSVALHFSRSNLLGAAETDEVILEDSDPNKLVIVKAVKQYAASGVIPSADSIYDDVITKVDEVPEDLLSEELDGETIEQIFKFIRSMSKGRIVKETLGDGDYHTFYLPNATTPLFKIKITETERTEESI